MPNYKQAVLLVNTHSRKGKALASHAEKSLQAHGINLVRTYALDDPEPIDKAKKQVVAEGADLLIVGGGDGTISEVVDHLAYQDIVLGYIPLGTTNNFARSLGIPLDAERAIEVIANGRVANIDLGKIGEGYFANVASIGVTVEVADSASTKAKKLFGRIAYAVAGAKQLFRHRSFEAVITTSGESYEYRTHQIVIANGRFHGGTLIARDASIDNHSLIIFHLGDSRRMQLLRSLILFTLGKPRTLREGNFIVTTSATITTTPPRRVEVDGEIKTTTPIEASLAPEALKVMVPSDFLDD